MAKFTRTVISLSKSTAKMSRNMLKKRKVSSDDESDGAVEIARENSFAKKPKHSDNVNIDGEKCEFASLETDTTNSKGDIEIEVVDMIPGKVGNSENEDLKILSVDDGQVCANVDKQIKIVAFIPGAVECAPNGDVDVVTTGSTQDEPIKVPSDSNGEDDTLTLVYSASEEDETESAEELVQNQLMDPKVRELYDRQFNGLCPP